MKYSFLKGLFKVATQAVIWGVPVLLLQYPTTANLTISALAALVVNYLKVRNQEAGY